MNTLLLQNLAGRPWAILPATFASMIDCGRGIVSRDHQIDAAAKSRSGLRAGTVAVLPLTGLISQRQDFMSMFFGGTSTEAFGAALARCVADDTVSAIVIDCDSPGGAVDGVQELADQVYKARQSKPVIAVANSLMASAAYWICSQATEIVASPSSMVGSIGVIAMSEDDSKALEDMGIKVTVISTPQYKAEGNPFQPLTQEAQDYVQKVVDDTYSLFVAAVARGRGMKASDVRTSTGEGRVMLAKDAVTAKLADRQGTLRDTLAKLGATLDSNGSGMRADAAPIELDATEIIEVGAKAQLDRAFALEAVR